MKKKIIGIITCFFLVMPLIVSSTGNDNERQPDWIEDFDSYSNGQVLDGTPDDGGWKGWENNSHMVQLLQIPCLIVHHIQ